MTTEIKKTRTSATVWRTLSVILQKKQHNMINNDRGQSLISKYVWVIETIYRRRKITFKELNFALGSLHGTGKD